MIITRTPLRLSISGGGTDIPQFYNKFGGRVIGCPISLSNYLLARPLPPFFDYKSLLVYAKIEHVNHFDSIEHRAIKQTLRYLKLEDFPLELHNFADCPSNSGLATSSSFIVGLLLALRKFSKVEVSNLSEVAIEIERSPAYLNESGGRQDEYLVNLPGLHLIEFPGPKIIKLPLRTSLAQHLLLLYTKKRRNSGEITSSYQNLDSLLELNKLTDLTLKILEEEDYPQLGYVFNRAWELKRGLSSLVSDADLDRWTTQILKHAHGVRLIGSGGGGCLLCVASPEKHQKIIEETGLLHLPFEFVENGAEILYEQGVYE